MAKESPARHTVRHHRADSAGRPADGTWDSLASSLVRFHDVLVVAGKELVTAVAAQDHFYMLGGQLRHHVGGNRGRVAEWFVQIPRQVLDYLHDVGPKHEAVV